MGFLQDCKDWLRAHEYNWQSKFGALVDTVFFVQKAAASIADFQKATLGQRAVERV